jgi:hypothetical protein
MWSFGRNRNSTAKRREVFSTDCRIVVIDWGITDSKMEVRITIYGLQKM